MSKKLKFLQICPCDSYYVFQVHLWLESLKEIGHSDKAISLIFTPQGRERNLKWDMLIDLYPEAEFHFYKDEEGVVSNLLGIYIPVLRPYTAWKHFELHPELTNDAIFYCDSDIIFMKDFDISHLLDDEVIYLSDTNSYINASYFDSKIKDVMPHMLSLYKERDVLEEVCNISGITRQTAEKYNLHSGGAQYLLKNISSQFWKTVMENCISINLHLREVNQKFFENENKGTQKWCSDMWAVLHNLWANNQETKVVPELNFAWSTDPISKLNTHTILHNAGITGTSMNGHPTFFKGMYHNGGSPFKQGEHLYDVLESEESQKYCTGYYANKLNELNIKYNLHY